MSARRVVVTGLGLIAPVGNSVASAWEAVCNGKSGIGPVTDFDASQLGTRIAGEIRGFEVTDYLSGKEARRYDTFVHYVLAASHDALSDAGIEVQDEKLDLDRVG